MMPEAHVVISAAWCIVGFWCGAGAMTFLFWRRLSRPSEDERRRLEQALDDAQAQLTRKQEIIDELTAQVAQLYRDSDRLARRYVELAGRTREKVT
jgi:uncharacterized membrane-anchored protein YhcB (DUF1043 family)